MEAVPGKHQMYCHQILLSLATDSTVTLIEDRLFVLHKAQADWKEDDHVFMIELGTHLLNCTQQ
ncbi:hypothetical protein KC19_4G139700 [Ceratodon purpureus]|uniref:Uncharacterized protein n=1 Tax=Ceratodon purpureus TaxID=3225 RepID=A0A8T0IC31_CERPU|nr:hypothetical protein KC19_4G139700 [Ceratodon purpureus]